jgi:predicted nucleotide-binding protein
MTDAELRGRLLTHFYDRRYSNGGFVPVDDLIIAGAEPVPAEAIEVICRQLREWGLIEWTGYVGGGPRIGSARITANGSSAVEHGSWAGVKIHFPGRAPAPVKKEISLRRDPQLIQKLLEKLEEYPAKYGDVFTLNGDDPLLAVDGFTSDQINYHLEQLREMGYVDDPGSQPAIGITFSGLSPRGHDFLERNRVAPAPPPPNSGTQVMSNKVFIVHGHDEATKNEVALFLTRIGLEPIILHLRPNGGRHLLTKFTEESEGASFAVVLMTPDDEGGPVSGPERKARARQNVVFELGFFIGRMGPSRVAALLKGDVEKPSDFDGIGYVKLDQSGQWKNELARELLHAKVPVDAAKALMV